MKTFKYEEDTATYYCENQSREDIKILELKGIDFELAKKINKAIGKAKEITKNKVAQDVAEEIGFYTNRTVIKYIGE